MFVLISGCNQTNDQVTTYEANQYVNKIQGIEDEFASTFCVSQDDISLDSFNTTNDFHAMFLADIDANEILLGENLHEQIYPASTTKLMTLYLALKYGDLESEVSVSSNAVNVPADSSRAWLSEGDRLSLKDLLYALMLPSGNDAAVAVAEHISGSEKKFVKLMNQEAKKLGATNSHFTSPHGYQDANHYTTIYDLYLILNAVSKFDFFDDIVTDDAHKTTINNIYSGNREVEWFQSNQYISGVYEIPDHITLLGGKTGTTNEAGACLTLFVENSSGNHYIAMLMGADTKPILYETMTELLEIIPQ